MNSLRRLTLKGFKSIREMDLELRPLNILIGANGAGKTNLISYFELLREMMAGHFQLYVAGAGRAHTLLHFGPKRTQEIEGSLEFVIGGETCSYSHRLYYVAGDTLAFAAEEVASGDPAAADVASRTKMLGVGHEEAELREYADDGNSLAGQLHARITQCRPYHFHDTSLTARVRQHCYMWDNKRLHADAGNLAAILLRFRNSGRGQTYKRIVATIRQVAPFFRDFDLQPSEQGRSDVILNWFAETNEAGGPPDQVFGPHQLSDGTLRAMCLITLLLQPTDELPAIVIVDEPELGLHPYALGVIAALFKKASHHTQVLVSTQSTAFLDHFDPEDVVVVDRKDNQSVFTRPDQEQLDRWLEEYSLGEVWEKGVIGGGPH